MADKKTKPVSFEFEGKTFECDPKACHDYKVVKAMAKYESDPAGYFAAIERVLMGRDEEYAEMLGGDMKDLEKLVMAAFEVVGAKN